jgi:hypothetical protein
MTAPVTASERDLRALAAIVSEDRPDLPDGPGLPPSLLTDLMGQIRCDMLSLDGWDAGRQMCWFSQEIPSGIYCEARAQVFWANYWVGRYPTRTGDLRSVIMTTRRGSSTVSWYACPGRCRQPPGPAGTCS